MKKLLLSILFVSMIFALFAQIPAYALDTTTFTIENRTGFTVRLKSNSLVFTYEVPDEIEYESAVISLYNGQAEVYSAAYDIDKINGAKIDLTGFADGLYRMEVIYFPVGTAELIEAMMIFKSVESSVILENEELYQIRSYENDDGFGYSMERLRAWANAIRSNLKIKDYDGDGKPDKYSPYLFSSYEEAYEEAYHTVFYMLNSGESLLDYLNVPEYIKITGGKASFNFNDAYFTHMKRLENLRTDEYALDCYKNKGILTDLKYADVVKQAQIITDGISDDYKKAKAIQQWVTRNVIYDFGVMVGATSVYVSAPDVLKNRVAACEGFANLTVALLQAVGIPAKKVTGTGNGIPHAWTEAFVDNRWVFIDSTWGDMYFDMPPALYSASHLAEGVDYEIAKDKELWDGTLYFFDMNIGKVVKEVKNFPLNGLVTSTYGFDINDLYFDPACTKPFTLDTLKVDSLNRTIFVSRPKDCTVAFHIQLDNEYKSLVPYVIGTEGDDIISSVTVPYGSKITPPKPPVKDGYTFIGWYDSINIEDAKLWDFEKDIVTEDMMFLACFIKESASYTVSFNSNGGTAVKSSKVKAGKTITKPADPTKKGYRFIGWYKDSKCTKPWNFATDIVTADTTLHAGWIDANAIAAIPTSSRIYVNGRLMEFEAYTINGNNYFKLRDIARAVRGTDKNFEVTWDGAKNAINLISNHDYTSVGGELTKGDKKAKAATVCTSTIYKDGEIVNLSAYTINGNNYFKLRDIAQAFNIAVSWDGKTNSIIIDTSKDYVP